MNLQNILDRIKKYSVVDTDATFRSIVEETGELAIALSVENKTKLRQLDENAPQETIDIILCCFEMLVHYGYTEKMVGEYMEKKLKKWKDGLDFLAKG